MIAQLEIATRSAAELVDITAEVQQTVKEKGMQSGVCHVFVPHTTAGLTLNENWEASLMGASQTILVEDGRLVLGAWQGIYLAEFDGPRRRRVLVKLVGD